MNIFKPRRSAERADGLGPTLLLTELLKQMVEMHQGLAAATAVLDFAPAKKRDN
jgi:hypothetical protein